MKAAPHIDYKALYTQSLAYIREQQNTIDVLHQDVAKCVQEQQRSRQEVASLQKVLMQKERQIEEQQTLIASHQHTIGVQAAQIQQQQALIAAQSRQIAEQQKELEKNSKELLRMALLRHQLRMMKKMIYGRRSEKHYPSDDNTGHAAKGGEQLSLGLEVEAVATRHTKKSRWIEGHLRVTKQIKEKLPHPGRRPWPEGLREEVICLDSDDKPKGAVLVRIEEHRQLALREAEFYLKVYRQYIYMAPAEAPGTFRQLAAPLPAHPIDKCKADISLLVKLTIDKFLFHLPVWRQQQRFKLYGIELPYNTLCHWVNTIAGVLEPLYKLLLHELIISRYLMMDETTYRVLDNEKEKGKKSHIGYLWACCNPVQRIVAFTYQKGRGKKQVAHILQGYTGYLQTDGYAGYTGYGRQAGVIHLQCMAHTRRYFVEARSHDLHRSDYALEHFFAPLYHIEQQCRDAELGYDQITEVRRQQAAPVLDDFYGWLQQELPKVIAGTPIYKAIAYALHRFAGLRVYLSDGMLEIDNNIIERQIRPVAVGRRGYLFAGSHRGGERAAIIYSLLGTCKLQGIEPSMWLQDVLARLPAQAPDKLMGLLPQFWKPPEQEITSTVRQQTG